MQIFHFIRTFFEKQKNFSDINRENIYCIKEVIWQLKSQIIIKIFLKNQRSKASFRPDILVYELHKEKLQNLCAYRDCKNHHSETSSMF